MTPKTGSPRGKLDRGDGKAAIQVAVIVAIVSGAETLIEFLSSQDFGHWTPAVAALLGVIGTLLVQWRKDNTKAGEK